MDEINGSKSEKPRQKHRSWTQTGDYIYHRKRRLGIDHSTYSKSLIYKLLIKTIKDNKIRKCKHNSSEVFDRVHMHPREAALFHSIGDSNLHVISAYLDRRSFDPNVNVIRIIAAGLYPFPGDGSLYCNYKCGLSMCSSALTGAVIIAGNHTDYPQTKETKSLMDAYHMVCSVPSNVLPSTVHITRTECGFSHNFVNITLLEKTGGKQSQDKIGVCVLPQDITGMNKDDVTNINLWIQYLKLQGFDGVHFYLYGKNKNEKVDEYLRNIENVPRIDVFVEKWDQVANRLEAITSSELAKNHCVYENMKIYNYIFVLQFQTWFKFPKHLHTVGNIIRSNPFNETVNMCGGIRVKGRYNKHGLVVQPNLILLTAANHFIPLTGVPSYRLLDARNLYLDDSNSFFNDPDNFHILEG